MYNEKHQVLINALVELTVAFKQITDVYIDNKVTLTLSEECERSLKFIKENLKPVKQKEGRILVFEYPKLIFLLCDLFKLHQKKHKCIKGLAKLNELHEYYEFDCYYSHNQSFEKIECVSSKVHKNMTELDSDIEHVQSNICIEQMQEMVQRKSTLNTCNIL